MNNRRDFLKQTAFVLGATTIGTNPLLAQAPAPKNKIEVQQNDIILFQGDSITDNSRSRETNGANDFKALGKGYALFAASAMLREYASKNIQIYNRGISGNKVPQLQDRWEKDCLAIAPTILSILIGVNDYWHKRGGNYAGSAQLYKEQYEKLLDSTLERLPNIKLIIGEPFAVKNVQHVDDSWFPEFAAYQNAAKEVAKSYKAVFIPYQTIFDQAEKQASGSYWTTDGVHTSLPGADLMAQHWLACFK